MGSTGRPQNTKYRLLGRHGLYIALFLLLYIWQSTPGFLAIDGSKPLWVLPAAIAVALWEGETVGGLYGAFAGLLCDISGPLVFGFNGFLTCLACIAVGLLVAYFVRCNLLSCLLFAAAFVFLRGHLEFLFAFGMWGYDNVWRLYVSRALPTMAYTVAVSPLLYLLFRTLHRYFTKE